MQARKVPPPAQNEVALGKRLTSQRRAVERSSGPGASDMVNTEEALDAAERETAAASAAARNQRSTGGYNAGVAEDDDSALPRTRSGGPGDVRDPPPPRGASSRGDMERPVNRSRAVDADDDARPPSQMQQQQQQYERPTGGRGGGPAGGTGSRFATSVPADNDEVPDARAVVRGRASAAAAADAASKRRRVTAAVGRGGGGAAAGGADDDESSAPASQSHAVGGGAQHAGGGAGAGDDGDGDNELYCICRRSSYGAIVLDRARHALTCTPRRGAEYQAAPSIHNDTTLPYPLQAR